MKYYAIGNLVGIAVHECYPWDDTLFINGVAKEGLEAFACCSQKIYIHYHTSLNMENVRSIGDGAHIGHDTYVDQKYGVRIEKKPDGWSLNVTQECNEWLVIAVQLSLLATNHTWIHGAALEKDGKVLLLPSWGGVGKTATVCQYVRKYGWKLLGDDLIIVGESSVYPFLKPFVIYPYHKDLFPELFNSGEKHIVKNLAISNLMSKMIPGVKRVLRAFPRVLAYLRKHNPQSMRVLPHKLFSADKLSEGGKLEQVIWLERVTANETSFSQIAKEEILSKMITVSSVELFASKLESVFHMCGCGVVRYDEVFGKMHDIVANVTNNIPCYLLEIPTEVSITQIGEMIHQKLDMQEGD